MKFGKREIVFIALLMAIPLGAWWFVFRPNNIRNEELMREIEAKQQKLQQLNQATAQIGDLKKEIHSLEEALEYFQAKLPSEKEIDKVLEEVWMLAESNNLKTKSIRTRQLNVDEMFTPETGPNREQPIGMQLEGDYMGFYSFLQALENQPRIMRVSGLRLKQLDKDQQGKVAAQLDLSIFFERTHSQS